MRELPRETRHERGVRGCSAGIERCSRGRCSSQKRSVARRGPQSEEGGMRRAAILQFFVETTAWGAESGMSLSFYRRRQHTRTERPKMQGRIVGSGTIVTSADRLRRSGAAGKLCAIVFHGFFFGLSARRGGHRQRVSARGSVSGERPGFARRSSRGPSHRRRKRVRSRQCQGFPRNLGRFHPGSGLSPSLDQLGAIEREASFLVK